MSILNNELHCNVKAFLILGCFLDDIGSDILSREPKETDLGGERTRSSDLTIGDSDVNIDGLGGFELGRN